MEEFQEHRHKLPPEAFVIAPDPEPEPSDPVDEKTWTELVWLTDDVSIRTGEHHGSDLREAVSWWGDWLSLVLDVQALSTDPRADPLSDACLVVTDEFQASIHAVLVGLYRQAIGDLRSALEAVAAAAYFRAVADAAGYARWADGEDDGELRPSVVRRRLHSSPPFDQLSQEGLDLWGKDGRATTLYRLLSGFTHGRPYFVAAGGQRLPSTNVGLWGGSNGPVYEARSMSLWRGIFFEAAAVVLLLTGLSEPRLAGIPKPTSRPYLEFLGECMHRAGTERDWTVAERFLSSVAHKAMGSEESTR